MPPAVNLTGQKFNRWTVVGRNPTKHKESLWDCVCECGTTAVITASNLKGNKSKSCGCWRDERNSRDNSTHKMSNTLVYHSWQHIKARCRNPQNPKYPDYGGRGITVCDLWFNSFEEFYAHVGDPPTTDHSLDRIDVNGHYEPGNVRWATDSEQQHNRRDNRFYTYKGKTQTLNEWAKEYDINVGTLWHRLVVQQYPIEIALTKSVG